MNPIPSLPPNAYRTYFDGVSLSCCTIHHASQLEETLTNEDVPPGLTGLIKGLIKNYKLDESLQQGAKYIESPGDRNAAASAGREALEFLAQTAEYFPVELDDR